MTPEQIDAEFKRLLREEGEFAASEWYKAQHTQRILDREAAEKAAARQKFYCELCGDEIPYTRGKPPKRCATCK